MGSHVLMSRCCCTSSLRPLECLLTDDEGGIYRGAQRRPVGRAAQRAPLLGRGSGGARGNAHAEDVAAAGRHVSVVLPEWLNPPP